MPAERRRIERFASLVDGSVDGVAADSDDKRTAELAGLLTLSSTLQRVPVNGDIDPQFRTKLRTRLVAMSAVREPAQVDSWTAESAAEADGPAAGRAHKRKFSRRSVVLGGVVVCALSVSGVGAASTNAVPGDRLYGIKRATESAQLRFAGNDSDRGRRYLTLARTRQAEARQVRADQREFLATLSAMDAATRQGSRLLTGVAANDQDRAPLDSIDGFVASQRMALGSLLSSVSGTQSRDRVVESLLLVERLRARSIALRAGLLCFASAAPADDLGPVPMSCAGGARSPDTGVSAGIGPHGYGPAAGAGAGPGASAGPVAGGDGRTPRGSVPGGPGISVNTPPVAPPAGGAAGAVDAVSGVVEDLLDDLGTGLGGLPVAPILPSLPPLPGAP